MTDSAHLHISVIICLVRYLDYAGEAIAAWLRQRYPRERFEVLVMWDRSDPDLDRRIQNVLSSRDRLIEHPSQSERELFDAGAWQARGDLLVFVEGHCVPEDDFFEKMSRFLAGGEYSGACPRTVGRYTNWIGRAISDDFDEQAEIWTRPGDQRKVIIHAFGIFRQAYLKAGGYLHRYGIFADWELAVRLELNGRRLGYAADARVEHHYSTGVNDTIAQYRSYATGECAFRLEHAEDYCDRWFGVPPEWRAYREEPADRRRILHALAGNLLRRGAQEPDTPVIRAAARAVRERLAASLQTSASWLGFRLAWLRLHLEGSDADRRQSAFRDMCLQTARLTRLRFVARHAADIRRRYRSSGPLGLRIDPAAARSCMGEIDERHLVGFYDLEHYEGCAFRWSRPNAAVRLALAPGRYRVELETRDIRGIGQAGLRIFFNQRAVPGDSAARCDGKIAFTLSPDHFTADPYQLLILSCDPLPRRKEEARQLGVSLFSLAVYPCGERGSGTDPGHETNEVPRDESRRAEREESPWRFH